MENNEDTDKTNIIFIIPKIPQDIKTLIYNNYFHPRHKFIRFFKEMASTFHPKTLIQIFRSLLSDPVFYQYVVYDEKSKKNEPFFEKIKIVKKRFLNTFWISIMFLPTNLNIHICVD